MAAKMCKNGLQRKIAAHENVIKLDNDGRRVYGWIG
jgi:hypothetical protein